VKLAAGIRRHGFRKWYERELLRSHAHLALTFVCLIGLFGALEAATHFRGLADQLVDALAVLLCAGAGLWTLRRYLFLLMHAEAIANQADCPSCGTYARFELVGSDGESVAVRCRKCAHGWRIDG
jgi:hypothetical protein